MDRGPAWGEDTCGPNSELERSPDFSHEFDAAFPFAKLLCPLVIAKQIKKMIWRVKQLVSCSLTAKQLIRLNNLFDVLTRDVLTKKW